MKWSDITDWEESTLETEYQQLCIREKEAEDWGREILELNKSTSWQGDARKAADRRVEEIDQDVAQFIVNLRAMKTATSTMQQGMGAVQGLVRDAKAHAEGSGLTIHSDGTVEDTSGTDWGDVALSTAMNPLSYALPGAGALISAGTSYEMNKAARQKAVDECADRVDKAVKKANEIDEAYSQALSNIEEGKVKPEGSLKHTVDGPLPMPQDTSDTRAVAEWWDSLSREEQERLADEEPDRIGNLDGVDAWARDRANRHRLDRDYEDLSFNTAIARLTEYNTALTKLKVVPRSAVEPLILMVAPLAPHIAEELWSRLGHDQSLAYEPFPVADPELVAEDTITAVVQVRGKLRAQLEVKTSITEDELRELALAHPRIAKEIQGGVRKVIVRAPKLVNVVPA